MSTEKSIDQTARDYALSVIEFASEFLSEAKNANDFSARLASLIAASYQMGREYGDAPEFEEFNPDVLTS